MTAPTISPPAASPPAAPATPAGPPIIAVEGVTLAFSKDAGLFDVNLRLPQGVIIGVIGPSGCGKSTLVRMLNGLYRPTEGRVQVMGKDPTTFTASDRERIGYMPQQFVLYPNLTAAENINFVASLYGQPIGRRRKRIKELLAFVDLVEAEHRLASRLSGGMQRRVMLAATLMSNPSLIYADEPTAGIDPILRERFWEHFRALRDEGRTLMVTTQYVGEATYCDLVALMFKGRVAYLDTPDNLRRAALGGESLLLRVEPEHFRRAREILLALPEVEEVRRGGEPGQMVVSVDSADERLPRVVQALGNDPRITVHAAEKFDPPYDEVFTRLIKQASARYG